MEEAEDLGDLASLRRHWGESVVHPALVARFPVLLVDPSADHLTISPAPHFARFC